MRMQWRSRRWRIAGEGAQVLATGTAEHSIGPKGITDINVGEVGEIFVSIIVIAVIVPGVPGKIHLS